MSVARFFFLCHIWGCLHARSYSAPSSVCIYHEQALFKRPGGIN